MPFWVYDLPDDLIIAMTVLLVGGSTALAILLARTVFGIRLRPDQGKEVMDAYRSVASLTALVLAFSLVQAMLNLRRVEADVRGEATGLISASRALPQTGDARAEELRGLLATYGDRVLAEEWPMLTRRGRNPNLDALLVRMLRVARAAAASGTPQAAAYLTFAREVDRLSDLREARITAASLRLPRAFWRATAVLLCLGILLVSLVPWTIPHLASALVLSCVLGVLVGLVGIVDVPFRGESGVTPAELRRALDVLALER